MGVSETVSRLAIAIQRDLQPTLPRHKMQLDVLMRMPSYRDAGKLPTWEADFQDALPETDDNTVYEEMAWLVFELGRHNLYCAFDAAGTKQDFDEVCRALRANGVNPPKDAGLSEW